MISGSFEFALAPDLVLLNDFAVRRETLDLVPWPCAIGTAREGLTWANGRWQATSLVGTRQAAPVILRLLKDAAKGRIVSERLLGMHLGGYPLRDFSGVVIAVLLVAGAKVPGWEILDQFQTGIAVAELRRFIYVNAAVQRVWQEMTVGASWDGIPYLPDWSQASRLPAHRSSLGMQLKGALAKIYRSGSRVVVEVLETPDAMDRDAMGGALHAAKNSLAVAEGFLELADGKVTDEACPDLARYLRKSRAALGDMDKILTGLHTVVSPPYLQRDFYGLSRLVGEAWKRAVSDLGISDPGYALQADVTLYVDVELFRGALFEIFKHVLEVSTGEMTPVRIQVQVVQGDVDMMVYDKWHGGIAMSEHLDLTEVRQHLSGGDVGLWLARQFITAHGGRMQWEEHAVRIRLPGSQPPMA